MVYSDSDSDSSCGCCCRKVVQQRPCLLVNVLPLQTQVVTPSPHREITINIPESDEYNDDETVLTTEVDDFSYSVAFVFPLDIHNNILQHLNLTATLESINKTNGDVTEIQIPNLQLETELSEGPEDSVEGTITVRTEDVDPVDMRAVTTGDNVLAVRLGLKRKYEDEEVFENNNCVKKLRFLMQQPEDDDKFEAALGSYSSTGAIFSNFVNKTLPVVPDEVFTIPDDMHVCPKIFDLSRILPRGPQNSDSYTVGIIPYVSYITFNTSRMDYYEIQGAKNAEHHVCAVTAPNRIGWTKGSQSSGPFVTYPFAMNDGWEVYFSFKPIQKSHFLEIQNVITWTDDQNVEQTDTCFGLYEFVYDPQAIDNFRNSQSPEVTLANSTLKGTKIIPTEIQGTLNLTNMSQTLQFTNTSVWHSKTHDQFTFTHKYWNKNAWRIISPNGTAATIAAPSEAYNYLPQWGTLTSMDLYVEMENWIDDEYIDTAYMFITITRPLPERTSLIRTMPSIWISGDDHNPNTNNANGNYLSYQTSANSHTNLKVNRFLSDPMPPATTYIFKSSVAANNNFVIKWELPLNVSFNITVTINGVTSIANAVSGTDTTIIDYGINSGVVLGLNMMSLTFNVPVGFSRRITNITTNLPPEYDITSKRIYSSATRLLNTTVEFGIAPVPPGNDYFTIDQTYKTGNSTLLPVEFKVSKLPKHKFGGIRIIGGGGLNIQSEITSPATLKILGPIGTQDLCMMNITQFCKNNPDNWQFVLSRYPGGMGVAYNTVQYEDNL